MSKKKEKNKKKKLSELVEHGPLLSLKDETKNTILAITFFVMSIFLLLSSYGMAGVAGEYIYSFLSNFFGSGYLLFPTVSLLLGFSFLRALRPKIVSVTLAGGTLFLISTLALVDIIFRERTGGEITGGIIGRLTSIPFVKLFDNILSIIILGSVAVISTIIIFESNITLEPKIFGKRIWGNDPDDEYEEDEDEEDEDVTDKIKTTEKILIEENKNSPENSQTKKVDGVTNKTEKKTKNITEKIEDFFESGFTSPKSYGRFTPPPLSIFENDSGKPGVGDIKANANIIKRTLYNFGIDVEMDEISIGPSVTRYALKPAEGVKLSRIVSLQNDLSLSLAAHPLRIEAPIPGKSLVGIEIPNKIKSIVGLGSLFGSKSFQESTHPLYLALGRGVSGIPYFTNLAKAPHMLIAGTTGSGKSVTIHTIVSSLLYRNPPEKLRLIMIDPKRVELTLYNGISHLLTGVITDPKKAILALKWATKEMERRYNILESVAVKDIQSYHKTIEPILNAVRTKDGENEEEDLDLPEAMPYIVIIIDELADIMTAYPRELEAAIVRLAQMSRAVGIHLILSTQRPSVEIITGLIKANIPTRVALQVPSQIDSRTILDMPGAEKLLGAGDMLFIGNETSKAVRIQSGYVSETEIKNLVKFLKERHQDDIPSEINIAEVKENDTLSSVDFSSGEEISSDEDEAIFAEAKKLVILSGKASSSMLQRKLKLGYARAARIIDMLEERGVVGPGEGSKPREVYMKGENMGGAVDDLSKEYDERENSDTEKDEKQVEENLDTDDAEKEGPYNEVNKELEL